MVWAVANSNLALVKYWGKADEGAKHPAAASLSLTLDSLSTVARVEFSGRFVEWRPEAGGSVVEPIAAKEHWDLRVLVAVTSERPKAVSSSEGMRRTEATSPYYRAWLESGARDLAEARAAIRDRSLERIGTVAERNCLRMHAA